MMVTYYNYMQLKGKILNEDDVVEFKFKINNKINILPHNVYPTYLCNHNYGDYDAIFDLLNLNKEAFATKHYGYAIFDGCFPCARTNDYEALTRIALALFKECEKTIKPIWSSKFR